MIQLRLMLPILLVLATPLAAQQNAESIPASAKLLPASTQGWVSFSDLNQLTEKWDATQFGQLFADPAMKEFAEDLREQFKEQRQGFGLTWNDMLSLAGGEAALAIIHEPDQRPAHVAMVDISGKSALDVASVMAKVEQELSQRGLEASDAVADGVPLRIFEQDDVVRLVYFGLDGQLIATDVRGMADLLIKRLKNPSEENLGTDESFLAVHNRLEKDLTTSVSEADIRWFVDPFGMAEAQRTMVRLDNPELAEQGGEGGRMLDLVKQAGFDGLKGLGGVVSLRTEKYDVLSRIAIHAPRPWEKSLNMITLSNVDEHGVAQWVHRDVGSHVSINLNLADSFAAFEPLFDAVSDKEGTFDEVFGAIAEDPLGPMVDIGADVLGQLTGQLTLVTDNQLPINANSQRRVIACPIAPGMEDAVKEAVDKLMSDDEKHNILRKDFLPGVDVWELLPEKLEEISETTSQRPEFIPVVSVIGADGQGDVLQPPAVQRIESAALCVANGRLIHATHISFLNDVLLNEESRRKLADDVDLQIVNEHIDEQISARGWTAVALKRFGRTDEEIHTTYELARNNQLHESEGVLARLIRNASGGTLSEDGEQWFDGSKMPDFQIVRRFLRPSGQFCHVETADEDGFDGWFILSMTLRSGAPQPEVESMGPDKTDNAK